MARTSRTPAGAGFDISLQIAAPAGRVMRAFFDRAALGAWWQVSNSLTTPRTLGPYVLEWAPTEFSDEVLGRLGGVFRGTIVQYDAGAGFFLADAFWLPPDGDPIGPMAFEATFTPAGDGTLVRVAQSGFEESVRWRRYYEVVSAAWGRALNSLKGLLEK